MEEMRTSIRYFSKILIEELVKVDRVKEEAKNAVPNTPGDKVKQEHVRLYSNPLILTVLEN
jgi:hypothetical protein